MNNDAMPAHAAHTVWPAHRFFWALLDESAIQAGSRWMTRGVRRRRLGFAFEAFLPLLTIEQVHATYVRCTSNPSAVIACGIPLEKLRATPIHALSLTPDQLPEFLQGKADAKDFEMLIGEFTPSALKGIKRWCCRLWFTFAIVVLALFLVGIARRASHARATALEQRAAAQRCINSVISATASNLPAQLQLLAEMRQLEQTRSSAAPTETADAGMLLQELLQHWPANLHVQAESLNITPGAIQVRGRAPAMADVQLFSDSFIAMAGWRLEQPQSTARGRDIDFALRLQQDKTP